MRSGIRGNRCAVRPSAASVSAVAARSTRGCLCSRFGTVSLKRRIASGNVMSSVPLGSTIRVSKRRKQPSDSATLTPVRRYPFAAIKARVFLASPRLMNARGPEIGLCAFGQIFAPCHLERRAARTTAPSLCSARRASSRDRSRTAIAKPRTSLGFPTAFVMSSKWMCQQSLRCGSRRRVRTGIGAFERGRQGAATRIGRARYWSSGPFQSVKSYTAHHRCSVCPHALQSKRPLATTGRLIWIAL